MFRSIKVPIKMTDLLTAVVGLALLIIVGNLCWHVEGSQAAEATAIQTQVAGLDTTIAHEHTVEHALPIWQRHAQDYATLIPATARFASLIQDISNAATQAGVTWAYGAPVTSGPAQSATQTTTPTAAGVQLASPAPRAPGVSSYALTLGVDGTLANIEAFISGLQTLPRLVFVNGVTLLTYPYGQNAPAVSNDATSAPSVQVQGAIIELTYYSR